ncbi:15254_t:CDS:2, partial [Racocetra fulgida]
MEHVGVTKKGNKVHLQFVEGQDDSLLELEEFSTKLCLEKKAFYCWIGSETTDLRELEALMNKALALRELGYVHLARQVTLERAYVVRVADDDVVKEQTRECLVGSITIYEDQEAE